MGKNVFKNFWEKMGGMGLFLKHDPLFGKGVKR